MLLHPPDKLEMDLCCLDKEMEIRQMLLAKELPAKNKTSLFRKTMLKIGKLLITLGQRIETHFIVESNPHSLDIYPN